MAITAAGWSAWTPLSSSNVSAIRFQVNDKRKKLGQNPLTTCQVRFKNRRIYQYFRVRYRQYVSLKSSGRPGKLFYKNWRFGFAYTEV